MFCLLFYSSQQTNQIRPFIFWENLLRVNLLFNSIWPLEPPSIGFYLFLEALSSIQVITKLDFVKNHQTVSWMSSVKRYLWKCLTPLILCHHGSYRLCCLVLTRGCQLENNRPQPQQVPQLWILQQENLGSFFLADTPGLIRVILGSISYCICRNKGVSLSDKSIAKSGI